MATDNLEKTQEKEDWSDIEHPQVNLELDPKESILKKQSEREDTGISIDESSQAAFKKHKKSYSFATPTTFTWGILRMEHEETAESIVRVRNQMMQVNSD